MVRQEHVLTVFVASPGDVVNSMGVRPTQLTENRKNRLAKLFRILTCQMCRPDTHALTESA